MNRLDRHVFVCENRRDAEHPRGCCARVGGDGIRRALKKLVIAAGLRERIRINRAGCLDRCEEGPTIVVYPEGVWYGRLEPSDCEEIFERHLVGGEPVERLRIDRDETP